MQIALSWIFSHRDRVAKAKQTFQASPIFALGAYMDSSKPVIKSLLLTKVASKGTIHTAPLELPLRLYLKTSSLFVAVGFEQEMW